MHIFYALTQKVGGMSTLLQSIYVHIAAIIMAGIVHGAIAAWMTNPSTATTLPDQQVIKISVVSAPKPPEDIASPIAKAPGEAEPPPSPPKREEAQNTKEVEQKPPLKEVPPKQRAKPPLPENFQPFLSKPSAGPQRKEERQASAVTKPFAAAHLNNPRPYYPLRARRKGYQGTVLLDVIVQTDGRAKSVSLAQSSGHEMLDKTALQTVRRWRFIPAHQGRKPVETTVQIPITFKIK